MIEFPTGRKRVIGFLQMFPHTALLPPEEPLSLPSLHSFFPPYQLNGASGKERSLRVDEEVEESVHAG